jgi:NAD-dependent dihydropyrimidine dehydrogenase PreA subunit
MIEFVIADRCTGCGTCVEVCPTLVFDFGGDGLPVIARQDDCQTCFLCELYCEVDALYVGADGRKSEPVEAGEVLANGSLGQYRRDSGWDEWSGDPRYKSQYWRLMELMRTGTEAATARRRG